MACRVVIGRKSTGDSTELPHFCLIMFESRRVGINNVMKTGAPSDFLAACSLFSRKKGGSRYSRFAYKELIESYGFT